MNTDVFIMRSGKWNILFDDIGWSVGNVVGGAHASDRIEIVNRYEQNNHPRIVMQSISLQPLQCSFVLPNDVLVN